MSGSILSKASKNPIHQLDVFTKSSIAFIKHSSLYNYPSSSCICRCLGMGFQAAQVGWLCSTCLSSSFWVQRLRGRATRMERPNCTSVIRTSGPNVPLAKPSHLLKGKVGWESYPLPTSEGRWQGYVAKGVRVGRGKEYLRSTTISRHFVTDVLYRGHPLHF